MPPKNRETIQGKDLPVELPEELFGYRKPTPENDAQGDQIIAEQSGYASVAALEAAIADGTCPDPVKSGWEGWQRAKPDRHATNARVYEYLERANREARAIRALHRRVRQLEWENDWLIKRVERLTDERLPVPPDITEEEAG